MKRGDVFWLNLDGSGSIITGTHPAVIVSNDLNNHFSPVVEVVYLSTVERPLPTHVPIFTAPRKCWAYCEQITSINKSELGDYICTLTDDEMMRINGALMISLGIIK